MKKIISLLVYAAVVLCLPSCEKENAPSGDTPEVVDSELKGIWKLAYVRFEGGTLPNVMPFYAVIDPKTHDMVMVGDGSQTKSAVADNMKIDVADKKMTIIEARDYDDYLNNPDDETYVSRFPYDLLDGESLHLYPEAVNYIFGDFDAKDMEGKSFHMELYRATDLEAKVQSSKADGASWAAKATAVVIDEITDDGTTYKIDEYNNFVTSKSWSNTGGWTGSNWMSKLSDDMPVAYVNMPGSHDSATSREKMDVEAATTDACVQTYSILDQYKKGARYFDFRVGSSLKWDVWPVSKRMMTDKEMNEVKDLEMFHGPLSTNTKFIESMQELANEIRKNGTEFVFINVQAERESSGLYDWVSTWLDDWVLGTDKQSQLFDMVLYQSMKIANRLMKEFSRKYNDDIFIPYSPDLTVGQARGHIIIMEDKSNMKFECKSYAMTWEGEVFDKDWLRASFYTGWPSNSKGASYATMFTYNQDEAHTNDLYVQSFYEMQVSDKAKIERKEQAIIDLTRIVTEDNMNPEKKNVLGFDAMNANTGSGILKTYVFAHEFNGFTYELYVNKMLNGEPLHCGIVAMDHYGAKEYDMTFSSSVKVYGDLLSWAVIESNFYNK